MRRDRENKTQVGRQAGRWQINTKEKDPNTKIDIITVELKTWTQR